MPPSVVWRGAPVGEHLEEACVFGEWNLVATHPLGVPLACIIYLFIDLDLLGSHWLIKLYRFQVFGSVAHHPCVALCVPTQEAPRHGRREAAGHPGKQDAEVARRPLSRASRAFRLTELRPSHT